jgi:hypothetical protein
MTREGRPLGLGAVPVNGNGAGSPGGQQKRQGPNGTAASAGSGWCRSAHGVAAVPTQGRLAKPIAPLHGCDLTLPGSGVATYPGSWRDVAVGRVAACPPPWTARTNPTIPAYRRRAGERRAASHRSVDEMFPGRTGFLRQRPVWSRVVATVDAVDAIRRRIMGGRHTSERGSVERELVHRTTVAYGRGDRPDLLYRQRPRCHRIPDVRAPSVDGDRDQSWPMRVAAAAVEMPSVPAFAMKPRRVKCPLLNSVTSSESPRLPPGGEEAVGPTNERRGDALRTACCTRCR